MSIKFLGMNFPGIEFFKVDGVDEILIIHRNGDCV